MSNPINHPGGRHFDEADKLAAPQARPAPPPTQEWVCDPEMLDTQQLIAGELRSISRYAGSDEERDTWVTAAEHVEKMKIWTRKSAGEAQGEASPGPPVEEKVFTLHCPCGSEYKPACPRCGTLYAETYPVGERVDAGAHPAPEQDERHAAEDAYTISAFDYQRDPVGSRDWELFWRGWRARAAHPESRGAGAPLSTECELKYAAERALCWMEGAIAMPQIGAWVDPVTIDMLKISISRSSVESVMPTPSQGYEFTEPFRDTETTVCACCGSRNTAVIVTESGENFSAGDSLCADCYSRVTQTGAHRAAPGAPEEQKP